MFSGGSCDGNGWLLAWGWCGLWDTDNDKGSRDEVGGVWCNVGVVWLGDEWEFGELRSLDAGWEKKTNI